MPLVLRPRQQNMSDPLYAATGAPGPGPWRRVPMWVRLVWGLTALCFLLAYLPESLGSAASFLRWPLLAIGILSGVPVLYRAARHGMLWRLRNKLILTYLLIGLTPVVLFFTLVFLAAYVAAGQFAIHLAASHLQLQLDSMGTTDAGLAFGIAHRLEDGATVDSLMRFPNGFGGFGRGGPNRTPGTSGGPAGTRPAAAPTSAPTTPAADAPATAGTLPNSAGPGANAPGNAAGRILEGRQRAIYVDKTPVDTPGFAGNARSPLRMADWVGKRRFGQLKVFVADGGVLYMAVVDRVPAGHDHTVTVIGSVPVSEQLLNGVADGLGQVTLVPGLALQQKRRASLTAKELRRTRLVGGVRPPASSFFDYGVRFPSTLSVVNWETGEIQAVPFNVESRPSILFEQLFGSGLTGRISDTVRAVFLGICLVFAIFEIFAFYVAMRLTRTMTGSVEDLYAATLSIDSGNLAHRIQVQRDDQLADLCRSFNRMSWSLGRLIEEQKEKERMQSELSIAQEVQANLFPQASVRVPSLQLHGICRPARTVSGDYYDFLVFHDDNDNSRKITGLGLALGDISGKGISAALLMATLHSAVRAYRLASEELYGDTARALTHQESLECGELFESPARILSLLNKHLYRSTQPEKYATLFLAHYDDASGRLTYSNAGQLPPFILKRDGRVIRLDKGGTVVGLMDGMHYEQETVTLDTGDLLIAYSDGVTEPENDFGEFGEDRLLEVVREHRDQPLEVISHEVMAALDAWIGGGEQPDDITLVLARKM
ncbi:serine phosphatase RsbU, regulator of sigma subunit [Terriglobus roseus DSM 18391]|uniref:Serine phosphatase RsbU, regulator of sigma subunit n=1 Tax=Terriglobus roseus (strain DSM 18391 / NRRL B-41598 / KBS 63) TaxID=926566 RepID=I3ZGB9_TERRK|nr:PP2C family protein-serine/threonine phosphatase [Terriglobus roseus]AFL88287.1 serine phosphatase RsbU, regulator of sigma subunit [Terriglobus roseus DSM 18391]